MIDSEKKRIRITLGSPDEELFSKRRDMWVRLLARRQRSNREGKIKDA